MRASRKPYDLTCEPLRPLKRVEYDRMIELGMFEGEHVELLGGMLVARSPIGGVHSYVVTRLVRLLILSLDGRAAVQPQGPLAATDESEPEPDVLVVPLRAHRVQKPTGGLLVAEVADSSLRIDRGFKRQLYAGIGIKDFWLVNIPQGVIEVYRGPRKRSYARCTVYRRGQSVSPLAFPDVRIAVGEVLP